MNTTSPINDKLKNVFDEKSASAIRNADSIAPQPERARTTEQNNSDLEIRKLRNYVQEQDQRITVLIDSQNKLIGEFNKLESDFKDLKRKITQQAENETIVQAAKKSEERLETQSENLTISKEKQQTGAGEGLKNEEYSVEKFFYFGKK
jgi:5'-3' exonuclease